MCSAAKDNPTYVTALPLQPTVLSQGQSGEAKLSLKIAKGFHVQANPAVSKNYIPTTVTVDQVPGVVWGEPKYPPGKPYKMAKASSEILVYDGLVEINLPIKVMSDAKRGLQKSQAKLRYQACDDKNCFFPTTLALTLPFKIE